MTRPAFAAVAVAALAVGGFAGWLSVGESPPGATPTVLMAPGVVEDLRQAGDRSACAAAVVAGLAQIDQLQRAAYGEPEPFPDDLDPAFLPAGVKALSSQVVAECPELGLQVVAVECTEFPCITLWRQTTETNEHPVAQLERCDPWARVPHDGERTTLGTALWVGEDGTDLRIAATATYPPGWSDTHPVVPLPEGQRKTRFEARQEALFSDLQWELGARDLTEAERSARMLEWAEEHGLDEDIEIGSRARRTLIVRPQAPDPTGQNNGN